MRSPYQGQGNQVSRILASATRKRNSLTIAGLSAAGTLVALILTVLQKANPVLTYLLAVIFSLNLIVIGLLAANRFMAAHLTTFTFLFVLFSGIGLIRPAFINLMVSGLLVIIIMAGFSFNTRGLLVTTIASTIILTVAGYFNIQGIELAPGLPGLNQPATLVINLSVLLLGGAYLFTTLEVVEKSYRQAQDYQHRYQSLFMDSVDTIAIVDLEGNLIDINQSGLNLSGYTWEEATSLKADQFVVASEEYDNVKQALRKQRKVGAFEHYIQAKDGTLIPMESMPTAVLSETGKTQYIQVLMRDIRPRKQVEEYLNEYKQRYTAVYERAEYGFLLIDMDLRMVAANQQAAEMLNCTLSQFHHQEVQEFLGHNSYLQLKRDIERLQKEGELPAQQYRLVTKKGHNIWVEGTLGLVNTDGQHPAYVQWIMRDITEQKQRENLLINSLQEMETLAMTDPLTGLHNRRSIDRYAHMVMDRANHNGRPFCVMLIDVDQLKQINDTYGHHTGDLALSQCAQTLVSSKRRDDAIGRWGGDEFLVVLPNTSLKDAELAAQRIKQKINTIVIGQGKNAIPLEISIGISGLESIPAEEPVDLTALIDLADQAMYRAKQTPDHNIAIA